MPWRRRRERYLRLRPWKRHSLVLLVLGIIYVLIGTTYIMAKSSPERDRFLTGALHIMPLGGWGVAFIAVGSLSILSSRWPPASETWGYTALSGLSSLWGMFYLMGVIWYGAPPAGLSGALVWGGVAFLWWAISGLVNPVSQHEEQP